MKKIILYLLLLSSGTVYGQVNYKQVFKKYDVEGSITIYHQNKRNWLYSDSLDATRETLPGSSFKLINSCIALETGAIRTENELIKWDGKNSSLYGQKMNDWNKDSDLKVAYKNSNNWFFTELAKKIGRKDYFSFLKSCNYGNLNLSEKGDDFWNTGPFGISPKGQINFMRVFISEQLPFSPRTFRVVKELMNTEKTSVHLLADISGWTKTAGKDLAWEIGCVQMNNNVYYFATRITKPVNRKNPDFSKAAKEITINILRQIKAID